MAKAASRAFSAPFLAGCLACVPPALWAQSPHDEVACRALACSTLIPSKSVDDKSTNDCGYRNGNEWWVDYVAGSLLWNDKQPEKRVVVALFDDGALTSHVELRNQLWTNEAEANGKPGVDDDGNGYIDDVHGWDFVDDDADVSPEGECVGRTSHGTFM